MYCGSLSPPENSIGNLNGGKEHWRGGPALHGAALGSSFSSSTAESQGTGMNRGRAESLLV